jgi:hypothetical protein
MPDDVSALLAAIAETERIAREATPGPWTAFPPGDIAEWTVYGEGWAIAHAAQYGSECMHNEATKLRMPATVVEHANANAAHIALQDPASTLLRCEVDREIVELHAPHGEWRGDDMQRICVTCGRGHPDGGWVEGFWPCDTIRALARFYRVEVSDGG